LEVVRAGQRERINDPLNPRLAYSPLGSASVCYAHGHVIPDWTQPDPMARPGSLTDMLVPSRALRRDCKVALYLPARFRRTARYPLLVVHDGGDYLQYASAKTVLDNLIHRLDVAEIIGAFVYPGDRLTEYANSAAHARYLTAELLPRLEAELPLGDRASGRCLMGSSFGAVAALSTAYRYPQVYGSLLLQSGSFVFTDDDKDHDGGPTFGQVVRFVNRYRAAPRRVADRAFVSCGVFEPLIVPNRSMVPVFEETGMTVRYAEARDGHNWENWRDRLREGLSWIFPGPVRPGLSLVPFAVRIMCLMPGSSTLHAAVMMSDDLKLRERWFSDRLQQDITVVRWGTFGTPVLVLPSAGGNAEEIERNGLVDACGQLLAEGRVKLYSADSVAGQAMVMKTGSVEYRMRLLNQFHECVRWEVVPAIHADLGGRAMDVIAAGASIGAFNAVAVLCRYGDSAYGTGDLRGAISDAGHAAVIKPKPLQARSRAGSPSMTSPWTSRQAR
jgi:enterochelin esterase-like enzyme